MSPCESESEMGSQLSFCTLALSITCHRCAKKGHYASECPDLMAEREGSQSGTTLLMSGITDGEFDGEGHFQFLQDGRDGVTCQIGQDGRLPMSWILLDNQSTVDVFCNRTLLSNILCTKAMAALQGFSRSLHVACTIWTPRQTQVVPLWSTL